jgi:hypothetical protein
VYISPSSNSVQTKLISGSLLESSDGVLNFMIGSRARYFHNKPTTVHYQIMVNRDADEGDC